MAAGAGSKAAAVLWNGDQRVCDALFSLELHHRGDDSSECGLLVITATIQVANDHLPQVAALVRDRFPQIRLTFDRDATTLPLTPDRSKWRVMGADT
jgi:hypothetical protein